MCGMPDFRCAGLGRCGGRYCQGVAEGRPATLKDVAAASGVSRATVSLVLNDTPNQTVSEATQEKVLRPVRELGYKPHGIARALREGSSRIVVLFMESGNYSRS